MESPIRDDARAATAFLAIIIFSHLGANAATGSHLWRTHLSIVAWINNVHFCGPSRRVVISLPCLFRIPHAVLALAASRGDGKVCGKSNKNMRDGKVKIYLKIDIRIA